MMITVENSRAREKTYAGPVLFRVYIKDLSKVPKGRHTCDSLGARLRGGEITRMLISTDSRDAESTGMARGI